MIASISLLSYPLLELRTKEILIDHGLDRHIPPQTVSNIDISSRPSAPRPPFPWKPIALADLLFCTVAGEASCFARPLQRSSSPAAIEVRSSVTWPCLRINPTWPKQATREADDGLGKGGPAAAVVTAGISTLTLPLSPFSSPVLYAQSVCAIVPTGPSGPSGLALCLPSPGPFLRPLWVILKGRRGSRRKKPRNKHV